VSKWFRLYAELVDDPKVQMLPPDLFKAWVNLLCIASRNDGFLPSLDQVSFTLRCNVSESGTLVERLLNAGLIDRVNGGAGGWRYAPHGWQKRQFKSDTSTERVKRFRAVARNAPDTDTDTEIDISSLRSDITRASAPQKSAAPVPVRKPEREPRRTPMDELKPVLGEPLARDVIDHRQRLRKPLTARAAELLARQFRSCADPKAAAETMISNGWQGFNPEWMERQNGRSGGASGRRDNADRQLAGLVAGLSGSVGIGADAGGGAGFSAGEVHADRRGTAGAPEPALDLDAGDYWPAAR
jgi:hypothetical protein